MPIGKPPPRRSKWLSAVTWPELRKLRSYQEFTARYPWTVRPELGSGVITTEDDWREGVRRLHAYHTRLSVLSRRRALRPGENPYLGLVQVLAGASAGEPAPAIDWALPPGVAQVLNLPARRRELAALFSWAIPTEGAIAVLARHAPLVECGAGMGYWAAMLLARGVDAVAYDMAPPGAGQRNEYHNSRRRPWTRVQRAPSVAALRADQGRRLFLCWPPYDDDAASYGALRAFRGDVLVYVGEGPDGAAGSVRFHRELSLNWSLAEAVDLPHWPRLRDRLAVYHRNSLRRPHTLRDRCDECHRFVPTGSTGRCEWCFARHPPAMALRVGKHRVEYPREIVEAMPAALRRAFEQSPNLMMK